MGPLTDPGSGTVKDEGTHVDSDDGRKDLRKQTYLEHDEPCWLFAKSMAQARPLAG